MTTDLNRVAEVPDSDSTTSWAFAHLSTFGPSVTATVGNDGAVLVFMRAEATSTNIPFPRYELGCSIDGAPPRVTSGHWGPETMSLVRGLEPGEHTFTVMYRTDSGTMCFSNRRIVVMPLGPVQPADPVTDLLGRVARLEAWRDSQETYAAELLERGP